jgi:hypothetical protein
MMDKHLHIVSFDVPFPANYGGVIDVFFKIKEMSAKGIRIHLHCFEYGRLKSKELEDLCFSVNYYKRDISKKHFFKTLPYIVSSRSSEELVSNLLKDDYPILLEGLHTCQLLTEPQLTGRKISVRTHNIEHEYYMNLAQVETSFLKKYYLYNEAGKLKKYEEVLRNANQLIAISKNDERYFAGYFSKVDFVPAFHPHKKVCIKGGKGEYALYHGNLSVAENFNAVKYLITNVFKDSPYPLKVAGLNPRTQLKNLIATCPNIELIANPTDEELFELINNAQLNVSITFQATGLKLKLLNMLYNGRFCIANSKMLSGTALDELCIVANDADAIKRKIKELWKRPFTKREIEYRRQKLSMLYNNGHNVDKLIDLIT